MPYLINVNFGLRLENPSKGGLGQPVENFKSLHCSSVDNDLTTFQKFLENLLKLVQSEY